LVTLPQCRSSFGTDECNQRSLHPAVTKQGVRLVQ
jgi:hypothetical protein